jgi:hypothetical protein
MLWSLQELGPNSGAIAQIDFKRDLAGARFPHSHELFENVLRMAWQMPNKD